MPILKFDESHRQELWIKRQGRFDWAPKRQKNSSSSVALPFQSWWSRFLLLPPSALSPRKSCWWRSLTSKHSNEEQIQDHVWAHALLKCTATRDAECGALVASTTSLLNASNIPRVKVSEPPLTHNEDIQESFQLQGLFEDVVQIFLLRDYRVISRWACQMSQRGLDKKRPTIPGHFNYVPGIEIHAAGTSSAGCFHMWDTWR